MHHLRALFTVAIISIVVAFGYYVYINAPQNKVEAVSEFKLGDSFPLVHLKNINNEEVILKPNSEEIVIVNFWASWCGPCVEEVPSLIKLVSSSNIKIKLIAISGDSSLEDIQVFMKSFPELKNKNIEIVWDQDHSLMNKFDISKLPESIILDKKFKIVKKISGSIDWFSEDAQAYLKALN